MTDNIEKLERAKALILQNDLSSAKDLLDAVIAQEPNNQYALFELAKIYQTRGNQHEAETNYVKAIKIDTSFSIAELELAKLYFLQRRVEKSLQHYKQFLEKNPHDAGAHKDLGRLYESLGNPEEALKYIEKAAYLTPKDINMAFELGIAYREAGEDEKAADVFSKLLAEPLISKDTFLKNKALNELEISQRKTIIQSKPRALLGMIMNKCNISCRICDIWREGKWQEPDRILKEIVALFPYMEDICWQGGEVFLMKEFEDMMEEGTRHKNLNQVIFTNGLLLNETNLAKIAKGNVELVLSIDGASKETYEYIRRGGSFEKLGKALELIKEVRKSTGAKINTYLNPVICKTNYKEIEDFIDFAKKYEFTAVTYNPIRGYPEENIFESTDRTAVKYMRDNMARVIAKAKDYGIRFNNWLPLDDYCEPIKYELTENFGDEITQLSPQPDDCGCTAPKAAPKCTSPVVNPPAPARAEEKKASAPKCEAKQKQTETPAVTENTGFVSTLPSNKVKRMICYAPWQRILLDSMGQVRPYAFCTKWVGETSTSSLEEIWNNEKMQLYRKKIATHDYNGLCQPECISGQVRGKLCRPVEDR
jgi:MoaA/NifB/PqqE/SkfB family radical SAM enzyme/Tfp pilus assembly protein PilF